MNGFQNENEIIHNIQNNSFNNISIDLKRAILKINKGIIPTIIDAKKYGGTDKADLSISLDNKEYFISVKKGSGNSVHQEPIEGFIGFLKKNYKSDVSVFNDLRHFIWGDKTLDGSGNVNDRISASKYKKIYPKKVNNIQTYLNEYKTELLERFLVKGVVSNKSVDFILYGTTNDCIVVSENDLLSFASKTYKNPISIGVLNFQAWNRNIKGGRLSEHKRGQIQLKWGTLKNDIKNI